MTATSYLVTGGTGFIGSALVRRLVRDGHRVRVLDNNSRGRTHRLAEVEGDFEWIEGDVRDADVVHKACVGVESVCHLAYVNGTEFFYSRPELVLEVGVLGMMHVLEGCRRANVRELVLASSSEVYQTPPSVPTSENVPLSVPDPLNPRFSYGGGKIISELLTLNYGRKFFDRVLVFRPHNVYGPDMGNEHVIPQFARRIRELASAGQGNGTLDFPIQGTGEETRAFLHIDDFTDGLAILLKRGEHMNIYNIGTEEEVTIAQLAQLVAESAGQRIRVVPGSLSAGSTLRRCPDIAKLRALGYSPRVPLRDGVKPTVDWYLSHA